MKMIFCSIIFFIFFVQCFFISCVCMAENKKNEKKSNLYNVGCTFARCLRKYNNP